MKRSVIIVTIIALSSLALSLSAQDGLALMKVEAGARAAGMGGAFVSIGSDPISPVYNPAGAFTDSPLALSLGHNQYWENIRIESAYAIGRYSKNLSVYGGLRFAAVDKLEYRTGPSEDPIGFFDAHYLSFKMGAAFQVNDKLIVGAATGWFVEKIDSYRGVAMNLDLGALYQVTPKFNAGVSVTNLGRDMHLAQGGEDVSRAIALPTTWRAGGSYSYHALLASADLVMIDDKVHPHLGAEYEIQSNFVIRSGIMGGYDSKTFAAGTTFRVPLYRIQIDYAFVPYSNELGSSHQFNFIYGL